MPDYKDKTDLWLLHEYLWIGPDNTRICEVQEPVRLELVRRGYIFDGNGNIRGWRITEGGDA